MARLSRAAALLTLCALLLRAQTPPQEVVIHSHPYTPPTMALRAETNLVEVGLTVRDQNGQTVAGLQASDFEVLDNGVRQPVTAFSELRRSGHASATPAGPRFITFFFDDLHMGKPGIGMFALPAVKEAARAFATQFLKAGRPSIDRHHLRPRGSRLHGRCQAVRRSVEPVEL
jgi:hypothetical protein